MERMTAEEAIALAAILSKVANHIRQGTTHVIDAQRLEAAAYSLNKSAQEIYV
jgi:hypothetical protein